MMEENGDIFLAGGDALVYLPGPLHKKYFTVFVWGHPFSTYVSYGQFLNPIPLHAYVRVTHPLFVRDFIDLIISSPILILTFLILFYLRNSRIDVLTVTTSRHLIQFLVAYLGGSFR